MKGASAYWQLTVPVQYTERTLQCPASAFKSPLTVSKQVLCCTKCFTLLFTATIHLEKPVNHFQNVRNTCVLICNIENIAFEAFRRSIFRVSPVPDHFSETVHVTRLPLGFKNREMNSLRKTLGDNDTS